MGPLTQAADAGAGDGASSFAALRGRDFRRFWLGTLFMMFAVQVQNVALPWLAYEMTGSGLALGLVGLARGVTMLLVSPLGGAAADRFPRKRVFLATMLVLVALAAVTAVLVLSGVARIWHLVLLGAGQSAAFSLHIPSRQAHIPHLVPAETLGNALALNSVALNASRVTAPVAAGVLLSWKPGSAFVVVGLLFLACWASLTGVPAGAAPEPSGARLVDEVVEGFRYVWRERPIRNVLVGVFVAVLLGASFQFVLPIFGKEVLHAGPGALGAMFAATGVGSVLGSLISTRYSTGASLAGLQWAAGIGFGVTLVSFAATRHLALALAALLLVGFTSQGFMTINNVLLIERSLPRMYGRVSSIYLMSWAMMPAGALPMGALSELVGAPITLGCSGGVLVLAMVALRSWDRRSSLLVAAEPVPARSVPTPSVTELT